ncbi:hypothetical protein PLESTB_000899800 [Pleodorina starrii]|uniref:FAD-binding domain-containing protein n=1 Tax=Pleodorina starrii TaxID=330485 RepID=A0A9W6BNA5_9CHLO|nr:hypothetical protein PLESTB_000899800 [Pleodorina starrii]
MLLLARRSGVAPVGKPRPRVVCGASATHVRPASSARPGRTRPLDVIIIGGGIGGLSAASALLEAGARVRANAEKVLRLLPSVWPPEVAPGDNGNDGGAGGSDAAAGGVASLSDAIYAVGGPIMSGGFRSNRGDYLYYSDMSSIGLKDIQSNGLSISRRSLMTVLYSSLPYDCVTYGRRFQSFTAPPRGEPGKVQVTFLDGGVEECDVLVGADGIRSKVREQLMGGPVELIYSGTVCWRSRLPLSRIGGGAAWFLQSINYDSWAEYWGKGVRIGMFTVGPEATPDEAAPGGIRIEGEPQLAWYAFANKPESWRPEPGADEAARLRELFAGFASPVPELLAAVEPSAVHVSRMLYQQPRPAPWGAGRVTLLGDAAHGMLPTLGQGGCMAIEDSLELANELGAAMPVLDSPSELPLAAAAAATWDDPAAAVWRLEAALRRYEASRAPRTTRVAEQSLQVASLAMAESDLSVWLRNTIYRLTPKWAGDKQFEYLFKEYVPAWKDGVRLGRRQYAGSEAASASLQR